MARAGQEPFEPLLFVDLLDRHHNLVLKLPVCFQHNLILHLELAACDLVESQRRHTTLGPAENYMLAKHALWVTHLFLGADDI